MSFEGPSLGALGTCLCPYVNDIIMRKKHREIRKIAIRGGSKMYQVIASSSLKEDLVRS